MLYIYIYIVIWHKDFLLKISMYCNRSIRLVGCGERNSSAQHFVIKALTCGNLVTSLSRLSQVPQDVVRVHIHQPADQPQDRPWRPTKQKLLQHDILLTMSQSGNLCFWWTTLIFFFSWSGMSRSIPLSYLCDGKRFPPDSNLYANLS